MMLLTRKRAELGWSRAKLARVAELDQALVSKFELRRQVPYPKELHRLAKALKVPIRDAEGLLEDV